jgi:hypothetical protein
MAPTIAHKSIWDFDGPALDNWARSLDGIFQVPTATATTKSDSISNGSGSVQGAYLLSLISEARAQCNAFQCHATSK